jgi:hypothetical protein
MIRAGGSSEPWANQRARKVLGFANGASGVDGLLQLVLIAGGDHGEFVNTLVFAVTLVGVGLEVADKGSFHDGLDRLFLRAVQRSDKGEAAQTFRLQRTDGGPRQPAQVESREGIGLSAAKQ